MSTEKRKIGFYSLKIINRKKSHEEEDPKLLKLLIEKILNLQKLDRVIDIRGSKKFHLLATENFNYNCHNIVFNSAKYHHRPPLISKETANLRDNPKLLLEGELEKTHVTLKYRADEIVLLLEERKVGITIGKITDYFNRYFRILLNDEENRFTVEFFIIPKGDFFKELKKLERVRFGHIYVTKKILGSEFLNFANRMETVQENLSITLKAKKGLSIKETFKSFANSYNKKKIDKIRVYGKSKEGNEVMLDTDLVKLVEYVIADLDDGTGVVDSEKLFKNLSITLRDFNS